MDRVLYVSESRGQSESNPSGPSSDSVRLLTPDGQVYEGAVAVFRLMAYIPRYSGFLWMYTHIPVFRVLAESGYRCVAGCRRVLSRLIQ